MAAAPCRNFRRRSIGSGGTLKVAHEFRVQGERPGRPGATNAEGAGGNGGDGYGGTATFYISPNQDSEATVTVQLADAFISSTARAALAATASPAAMAAAATAMAISGGETFALGEATAELFAGDVTANQLQVFSTARGGNGGAGSAARAAPAATHTAARRRSLSAAI